MGRSEVSARAIATLAVVAAASCAQVTGLSDDYRYDLGQNSGEDGGGSADAGREGAAGQCSAAERTRADLAISGANGDRLPASCRSCLASSCCAPIEQCSGNADCLQAMRCVFNCQRDTGPGGNNNNKAQCLDNCGVLFNGLVGTCLRSSCPSPTCALE
jgi:hypothetical protein